jgi:hypothetical protein
MTIRSELEALFDTNGILRVETTHDWAAANPASDLYRALEWNEEKAAREYRYSQIRHLIQLHVVDEDHHRQAINLVIDRAKGGGYRRLGDVMQVPNLRELALRDALAEYERIKDKYDWLKELERIHEEIERAALRPTRRRRGIGREDRPSA